MSSGPAQPERTGLDDPHHLVECPAGPPPGRLRPAPPGDSFDLTGGVRSAPGVHWAECDGELVALDLNTDRYVALGPYASSVLTSVLTSVSPPPDDPQAQAVLRTLAGRGLIVPTPEPNADWCPARASVAGGVSGYLPRPRAGAARSAPGVPPGPALLAAAGRHLRECDWQARQGGLLGVSVRLRRDLHLPPSRPAPLRDGARLVRAHLAVRRFAPRELHPATAPAALARHAWRAGLPVRFVIGVQKYPFHSRVFVELDGHVLDDAPELWDVLAPIVVIGPPRALDQGRDGRADRRSGAAA